MTIALPRRVLQRVTERGAQRSGTVSPPATETPGADRPSWAEIVATHSPRVYRLAYRLTGNPYDAEDLTQDVFVRVFRSLDSFVPGNFEAWLHRITTNLFLDGARRRQRIRFDALAEDADRRLADHGPGPVERFDMTHLDGDVRAALMDLKPEFRAAVVLCDIEGLPYEEVAAVLDVKLGTVRSRIHRGRSQLRDALAHRAPGRRRDGDGSGGVVAGGVVAGGAGIGGVEVGGIAVATGRLSTPRAQPGL